MNAYLFNMGDTPTAQATLRSHVGPSDVELVDATRFYTAMDGGSFDTALSNFYTIHPDQVPPAPVHGSYDAGITNTSCH